MSPEEAESMLDKFFVDNFRRTVKVSVRQMAAFADKKGIPYTMSYLREMRSRFKFSAIAAQYRKPHHYMSFAIAKYGLVHLDYAVFHPEHKRQNGGHGGFIVGRESISQQLCVHPVRNGTTKSWEEAVVAMVEGKFNAVRVFCTDRDTALKNPDFKADMKKRFGVSWLNLKVRSKAFLAERVS
jgi:hypothetical protein